MEYTVVHVLEHYEVYDGKGNFLLSADTKSEAYREMDEFAA